MKFSCNYQGAPGPRSTFPSLRLYAGMAGIFYQAGKVARSGIYTGERWVQDSELVGNLMESIGIAIHIEGIEHLDFDGPCVFESNHMSTMETMFLPCVIQPRKDVTFVVKKSLLKYPCLGPVLAAREPLALGRVNPREDLAVVLGEGKKHLDAGRSVIIFTQGSRKPVVEEKDFNSLGVKLARKAGVPVVPIALKTDAWGEGSLIKDIGWVKPELPVHIRFGARVDIHGTGREEHAQITRFIKDSYDEWAAADGRA